MALYIFSDAHLGCGTPEQESHKRGKIAELFELVKTGDNRLVILGDLFDFWFEYKHAIPKEHYTVLTMMTDLVRQGITIDYVSGNHDFWMDDFFVRHIGINLHRDKLELEYDNQKIFLIHGDGLAPGDKGYRFLKRVLRHPLNVWLYRKLPPDWAIPLAKRVSGSSRNYTAQRDHTFMADYEQFARTTLANGYDIVVIGHLHIPVRKEFDTGIYINTGDFITHFSYGRISDGAAELLYLK